MPSTSGEFSPYEVIESLSRPNPYHLSVVGIGPDGESSFDNASQQETASLLSSKKPRPRNAIIIFLWGILGTIAYVLLNIVITSITTLLTALYILIGHAILNILPHLTIDYPLLFTYLKVGVAGGLVIGTLASLVSSTWVTICFCMLQWGKSREEVDQFRKGFSLRFLEPRTQTPSAAPAGVQPTITPAPQVNSNPNYRDNDVDDDDGASAHQPQTTTPPTTSTRGVVQSSADAMSWAVAGPVGVYVLQFYYDKFQRAEEVDVAALVDPLQAGLAIGLGRAIGSTFWNAIRRKQAPSPTDSDSDDGPK